VFLFLSLDRFNLIIIYVPKLLWYKSCFHSYDQQNRLYSMVLKKIFCISYEINWWNLLLLFLVILFSPLRISRLQGLDSLKLVWHLENVVTDHGLHVENSRNLPRLLIKLRVSVKTEKDRIFTLGLDMPRLSRPLCQLFHILVYDSLLNS
jgi:hypothetical protein